MVDSSGRKRSEIGELGDVVTIAQRLLPGYKVDTKTANDLSQKSFLESRQVTVSILFNGDNY